MNRGCFLSLIVLSIVLGGCDSSTKTPTSSSIQTTAAVSKAALEVSEHDIPFLVGTYTRKEGHVNGKAKGIHLAYLNTQTGTMRYGAAHDEAGINPSYLTINPSGKFVYVVNETGGNEQQWGSVTALAVNEDMSLTELSKKSTLGVAPCHISLDKQGFQVLAANYVTGSIISFPVALTGKLGRGQNIIRYTGEGPDSRQEAPHAHFISQLRDGTVVTADLGTDSIRFHNFGAGQLEPASGSVVVPSGSGPRHIVEHPLRPILYVVNELSGTIISFRRNADNRFVQLQSISTLPEGDERAGNCAAIKMTKNGKFLYASNRGDHNNIAIYKVDDEGRLKMVSHQSSLGNVPRDFEISPDDKHLIVANQNSDNLVSFKIDPYSGLLSDPFELKDVATPVCIKFF